MRLSTRSTSAPILQSRRARFAPMKPRPPVIMARRPRKALSSSIRFGPLPRLTCQCTISGRPGLSERVGLPGVEVVHARNDPVDLFVAEVGADRQAADFPADGLAFWEASFQQLYMTTCGLEVWR